MCTIPSFLYLSSRGFSARSAGKLSVFKCLRACMFVGMRVSRLFCRCRQTKRICLYVYNIENYVGQKPGILSDTVPLELYKAFLVRGSTRGPKSITLK